MFLNAPLRKGFAFMELDTTFNNIAVILWRPVVLVEYTVKIISDKLHHIILFTSPWSRFPYKMNWLLENINFKDVDKKKYNKLYPYLCFSCKFNITIKLFTNIRNGQNKIRFFSLHDFLNNLAFINVQNVWISFHLNELSRQFDQIISESLIIQI